MAIVRLLAVSSWTPQRASCVNSRIATRAALDIWRKNAWLGCLKPNLNAWPCYLGSGSNLKLSHARKSTVRKQWRVEAFFGKGKTPAVIRETIVPEPDYRIPIVLLCAAAALLSTDNPLPAAPIGLLGLLLLFQTTRVRFVFDDEALEVKIGEELQESGENVFVGGKNRWKYSSFVNWEFWWPSFPVLVYFKETQTKPEGQVHFFPIIFNGKQLYDTLVERGGPSQTSGPK